MCPDAYRLARSGPRVRSSRAGSLLGLPGARSWELCCTSNAALATPPRAARSACSCPERDQPTSEVEGGLALHGRTTASYKSGTWRIEHEWATPTESCDCPQPTRCLHLTGNLISTYAVTVAINMPGVPSGLILPAAPGRGVSVTYYARTR